MKAVEGYVRGIEGSFVVFTADRAEAKGFASEKAARSFWRKYAQTAYWPCAAPAAISPR